MVLKGRRKWVEAGCNNDTCKEGREGECDASGGLCWTRSYPCRSLMSIEVLVKKLID